MNVADDTPDLPGRLGVAVQMLAHAGRVSGGRGDLTPTRLTALAVIYSAGPMRLGGLAARIGVQMSTMSRIVDILVASGWAERRPDEADHRACVIGITEAGGALLNKVRQDNASRLADSIAGLDPADAAVLRAALPVLEALAQRTARRGGETAALAR
jgi:DNA-binding MarR family transcriptional regulator